MQTTLPTLSMETARGEVDPTSLARVGDRYSVLSYIGHGGMSVVFRARDRLTGRLVALKKKMSGAAAPRPGADEPADRPAQDRQRLALTREFRTLAALRHPNIIGVLDHGFAEDGEPFFTMELIEQPKTVLEAAAGRSVQHRAELLVQILRALSYLHRRGVIHRDLKPSNVLVDEQVRVLDFGIAVRRGEGAGAAGTLTHIAPEVLRGQAPAEASDLYAVGVMAYEMFAGFHPFRGFDPGVLRDVVLSREPDLDALQVDPSLRELIRRLMAKDPAGRPASAGDTIDALTAAAGLSIPRQTRATRESFLQAAELVDRAGEREALAGALSRLPAGEGGAWLVAGESGIGKSRLLDELRTVALVMGVKVVQGQARSEEGAAFQLWQEPLRHLLLGAPLDDAEAAALSVLLPDIDELVGRTIARAPVSPETARAGLLGAVRALFERQRAPVLVLLEDVHWAGEGLDVLRDLAPRLAGLPIMLVASFRSEEAPRLAETIPGARLLQLGPLGRSDIAELARAMLGSAGEQAPVVEFLDRHTEGNVLFVVEAVRALAEAAGSLERIGASPLPERLVASGIDAIVEGRLARIPEQLRRVFAWSAVIGRALDAAVLRDVFGLALVAEALETGTEMAILEIRDDRFRFAHDKLRERTLEALGGEERRALHGEVAAALERVHGRGKEWAATLAYHYREAGLPEKEVGHAALAGQAALEQGAYAEAARLLERALALNEALPVIDRERELDLLQHHGAVLGATKSWSAPEYERTYDRIVQLAGELGKQAQMIPALHGLALSSGFRGDLSRGALLSVRYERLAEDIGDTIGRVQAAVLLANSATWLGRHDEAELHHRRVIDLYEPGQLPVHMARYGWNPRVVAAVTHAASTCIRGEPDRAVEVFQAALEMAEADAHPFTLAIAFQIGAWVHHLRREVTPTLHHAEALEKVAREHGFPVFTMQGDVFGGWAQVLCGKVERGLGRLRSAVTMQRRAGGVATTFYASQLADACLLAGAVDEALSLLRELLGDSSLQERCYHPELYRLLGEALRARGDAPQAEAALKSAVTLAHEQGARFFEARALTGLIYLRGARPGELARLGHLRPSLGSTPEGLIVDALLSKDDERGA